MKNLPGMGTVVAEALTRFVAEAKAKGRSRDDLEQLELPGHEKQIEEAMAELEAEGEIAHWGKRWYVPRWIDLEVGTIEDPGPHGAFARTGRGQEGGYRIAAADLGGALLGDRVLLKAHRGRRREGAPNAGVTAVLKVARPTLVGRLVLDGTPRLAPFDTKVAFDLPLVPKALEELEEALATKAGGRGLVEGALPEGAWLEGQVLSPAKGGRHTSSEPRVGSLELIGLQGEPGLETEVVQRHHGLPQNFPAAALAEAEALPTNPPKAEIESRHDLRDLLVITIDGADARDFDDALSLEILGDGKRRLGVHIADASNYVPEGSELDIEAFRRGTSVYFPDQVLPMLPERLSNGLCSLKPDVPRLTLSMFLEVDEDGKVERWLLQESVIQSQHRLTYDEARERIEKPGKEAVDGLLTNLSALAAQFRAARQERGSLDFDLPTGDVILDTDGVTVGVRPSERHVGHRIVEEMMIAANESVAAALENAGILSLHRVLDEPPLVQIDELAETLDLFGVDLAPEGERIHPGELQNVLEEVTGREEEEVVTTLVLRSMRRAFYSTECRGHFALATTRYTHFTSPIRRYADLVVHRTLKAVLLRRGEVGELFDQRAAAIGVRVSDRERIAERAERELLQWKKVLFMAPRVGETFQGRVTGVAPFGLFVALDDLHVDGLLHVSALGEGHYRFDPAGHRLVGPGGRSFRLADRLEVELRAVSERYRGLDLGLVEGVRKRGRRW